jgi:aspartyl-tRNA synthetase
MAELPLGSFPKNNSGRDMMIESPSEISEEQLHELKLLIREDEVKK